MSITKDICCNPRVYDLVFAGWPPCCETSSSLGARARDLCASHFYHEKRVAWVSISMHACDPVPIVMGLRLAALWAAGAPLQISFETQVNLNSQ